MITPRTLKGFRDYLPAAMMARERIIETARRVYRSYGFAPIDTPALEHLEILTGKGSEETDRQLYKFQDHGGRWVGMRFDLTVPLARFAAQHVNELGVPFKRYHIATVWRGENTQAGRYREFMQCDFDTIGTTSLASDIETALVIHDLLRAIGFEEFTLKVNHRLVLNGVLERFELTEKSGAVLRSLDKLGKLSPQQVAEELQSAAGLSPDQATNVLRLATVSGTNDEILSQLEALVAGSSKGPEGVAALGEVIAACRAAGVNEARIRLDPSIARGLDYYTGTVFETFIDALPERGSVCSGGRYDNLAGLYTSQKLPGIGASLGLDRLLSVMEDLGRLGTAATPAPVFIPYFEKDRLHDYLRLASQLRTAGLGVELYPEPKKLGPQLKYADRRGCRFAVIIGSDEFTAGTCQLKDLSRQESLTISLAGGPTQLVEEIARRMAG